MCLSVCVSVALSICLPVFLSVCLYSCLSVFCLFVLYVCFFFFYARLLLCRFSCLPVTSSSWDAELIKRAHFSAGRQIAEHFIFLAIAAARVHCLVFFE